MREIRFRAWDDKSKKMWTPEVICFMKDGKAKAGLVMTPAQAKKGQHEGWFYDNPLMQYTGLHDKNGKEIYEGDIVACTGEKYIVSWHNQLASWYLKPVNYDGWHGISKSDMSLMYEIIGNLWENPELLGGAA